MAKKPGMLNRARLAWKVFGQGLPWSRWDRGPRDQKASMMMWPAWRQGRPEWQSFDFSSYVSEGFNVNSLIYSAISYKARAVIAAPLKAYVGDQEHPELAPPNHPLSKLLDRPNLYQSGAEFAQVNTVYLNLAGNVYVWLDRPRRGGLPTSMESLRPDRVHIIPEKKGIKGFLYVPEGASVHDGVPIAPEDLIHVKFPNPGDPLEGWGYGLSPVSPIARSGDVDNYVTRFLKLFFEHGTMPSTILKFKDAMDDDEIARIRKRWSEIYGGYESWTEVGVLPEGGDVQRVGLTFQEMGFGELDARNESRILGPFGVPPILLGTKVGLERSTYSNYEEARRAFWEDTFVPELQLFEVDYRYYLQSDDGGFVGYDLSRVPALQRDKDKQIGAAQKLWSMGMPLNMALQAVGMEVDEVPGGDIGYLPMNLLPVGMERPEPEPAQPGGAEAEEDERKRDGKALPGGNGDRGGLLPVPLARRLGGGSARTARRG